MKIAASILSADFANLEKEIKSAEEVGADLIHIDIMDGHFVPNITIGPDVVASIRKTSKLFFDVHLMIDNPELYIIKFIQAGADNITIHAESTVHLDALVNTVKSYNKKVAVAINPATSITTIEHILGEVDMVLVMTVNPGFGGQKLIPYTIEKVKNLKKLKDNLNLNFDIEVDGGVNLETISLLAEAGANIFVTGSFLFQNDDRKKILNSLKEKIRLK